MKKFYFLFLYSSFCFSQFTYHKEWSTYYFGSSSGASRSSIDSQGNIIVVGGIGKSIQNTFPTEYEPLSYYDQWITPNAFQPSMNGIGDGFITKFSPNGTVIWSTFYGGLGYETIAEVVVDSNDNIYVKGYTNSSTKFATTGAYITDYNTVVSEDSYSAKEYLAKFSTSGALQWCTYLPTSIDTYNVRTKRMCLGADDCVYVVGKTMIENANIVTTGAFQTNFITYVDDNNPKMNGYLLKFDGQGNRASGTYCGARATPMGITADSEGNIIIVGIQDCCTSDVLSSPSSYQPEHNTAFNDGFISKFSSDLATRLWSTYYGTPANNALSRVATSGTSIYCSGGTLSIIPPANLATPGTFSQEPCTAYMARFTGEGNRVWGTFLPFNSNSGGSIHTDFVIKNEKLYLVGYTYSSTGIATVGAYQENLNGNNTDSDSYFIQFSIDGTRNWGSYFGGERKEYFTDISVLDDTTFYLSGSTNSSTLIATAGCIQPEKNSGSSPVESCNNMFLAKFSPVLSTASFTKNNLQIAPNPSNGKFKLTGSITTTQEDLSLIVYDNLGRVIANQKVVNTSTLFQQEFDFTGILKKGIYFAKLLSGKESVQTFKVIVQ